MNGWLHCGTRTYGGYAYQDFSVTISTDYSHVDGIVPLSEEEKTAFEDSVEELLLGQKSDIDLTYLNSYNSRTGKWEKKHIIYSGEPFSKLHISLIIEKWEDISDSDDWNSSIFCEGIRRIREGIYRTLFLKSVQTGDVEKLSIRFSKDTPYSKDFIKIEIPLDLALWLSKGLRHVATGEGEEKAVKFKANKIESSPVRSTVKKAKIKTVRKSKVAPARKRAR